MWTSAELKMRAKGAFYKNYWHCVLTAFVMSFFIVGVSNRMINFSNYYDYSVYRGTYYGGLGLIFPSMLGIGLSLFAMLFSVLGVVLKIFVGNALIVGGNRFFIHNQTENPSAIELGYAFRSNGYVNVVLTMFLKNLYQSLWALLFVVPGVIKHYEYLMVPYIIAENPQMDNKEAFAISKRMMMGQKMNAFIMDLSFIGWHFVSGVTFGLAGIFFVRPYYQATFAELYSVNRTRAYQEGYIR